MIITSLSQKSAKDMLAEAIAEQGGKPFESDPPMSFNAYAPKTGDAIVRATRELPATAFQGVYRPSGVEAFLNSIADFSIKDAVRDALPSPSDLVPNSVKLALLGVSALVVWRLLR